MRKFYKIMMNYKRLKSLHKKNKKIKTSTMIYKKNQNQTELASASKHVSGDI